MKEYCYLCPYNKFNWNKNDYECKAKEKYENFECFIPEVVKKVLYSLREHLEEYVDRYEIEEDEDE